MTPPCGSAHLCDVIIIDCSYKMDIQFNMFTAIRTLPTVSGYNFRTSQHFSNILISIIHWNIKIIKRNNLSVT